MSESTLLALISGRDPDLHRNDGHQAYVRAHARAAIRAGYQPQIMCVGRTPSVRETDIGTIRRVLSPSRRRPRPLGIPVHGPPLVRALIGLARERPGAVLIHGFGVWSWAGVRACARLRGQGRQGIAVASAYDTYPAARPWAAHGLRRGAAPGVGLFYRAEALWRQAVIARYEGYAYRNATPVFVNYESVRRLITDHYGPRVAVRRLPYGLEHDLRDASEEAPGSPLLGIAELVPLDAPLVICTAWPRPDKGVDVLIEALTLAHQRGTPLRACVLGPGPLVEAHRRQVLESGLARSVAVLGAVPNVEPYLRAADIYAQPSRSELSGSVALLEALRAGVPAVASNVDGIPEDVDDGESALLVAPGDPRDLADALIRLAEDRALRERLGEGGRRRFEERFSAEAFAEALGAAYAELGFEPR